MAAPYIDSEKCGSGPFLPSACAVRYDALCNVLEETMTCNCLHVRVTNMIKIISYVVIAFFYWKANILCRWSIIQRIFNRNKGLCHSCRSDQSG